MSVLQRAWVGLLSAMLLSLPAVGAGVCPGECPADLDDDGVVGQTDLGVLLAGFGCLPGASPCPSDLDDDGDTDQSDLGLLLASYGTTCPQFAYPPQPTQIEAEQIALEMLGPGGGLFAEAGAIERVARDLELIRTHEPALAIQPHSMKWAAKALIVQLDASKPWDDYACLNHYYQGIPSVLSVTMKMYVVWYPRMLNPEALAVTYEQAAEVKFATPDTLIGGQNYYKPSGALDGSGTWLWTIDDGFLDCFDGCDCHVIYEIKTTEAGGYQLLSKVELGQPWCPFSR
jgi:hypothetical protein